MRQAPKTDVFLQTTSVTNGGTVTANLDTLGFDYVEIALVSTTADAATNRPSVLKLSQSDTTDATNFSDLTKFVGDGTGGFTIPSWHTNTATAKALAFAVDTRSLKRYLKLTVSPRTTQSFTAVASLRVGEQSPVSAADANVLALVAG